MNTKLTLKLDKNVIEKAKIYAAEHNHSLSFMVENYLKAVTSMEKKEINEEIKISDFVRSIGIDGVNLPEDFNYKKEIQEILCEKYGV
jgi:plasmid stability protein